MNQIIQVAACVFTMTCLAGLAHADAIISGTACVVDGNRLQVGGKIRDGKCWGGIDVRLFGSDAPELDQTCKNQIGIEWPCGRIAKNFLERLVSRRSISCYHIDGEFDEKRPKVTCISGRADLSLELVLQGMAKALHDKANRYELEENAAKRAKKGIWK